MQKFKRATLDLENVNDRAKKVLQSAPDLEDKEIYLNDQYQVNVRRSQEVPGMTLDEGKPVTVAWLSIKRVDKQAIHDWRDLQLIKNMIIGEEHFGMEIYPPESKLVDNANQYHLWVFEDSNVKLPIGFHTRLISESCMFGETQRLWKDDEKPKDLEVHERRLKNMYPEK